MIVLAKYGVALTLRVPILKMSTLNYAVGADWTPAAGDVKVIKDGTAANIDTLPTATAIGNSALWTVSLTGTEMSAEEIIVLISDASTKVIEDQTFIIHTYGNASARHAFDLDTATVNPGAGGITSSSFAAGAIDAAAIAADAIGSSELAASAVTEIQSGLATSAEVAAVQADTDNIQTRLPAALVSGRMDSSVGAMAAAVVTAAAVATDAIDADALAADAVAEIQSGLATAAALAAVDDFVDTEVAAIKAKTDNLPAAPAAVGDIPTAATVADAVWDEATSGHVASGSFGQRLTITRANTAQAGGATTITLDAAASATDSFYNGQVVVLTAGTGAGQARQIASYVGATKVATVDTAWATNPDATSVFVIVPVYVIAGSGASAAAIADAVWDEAQSGHTSAGTFGKYLDTEVSGISAGSGMTLAQFLALQED